MDWTFGLHLLLPLVYLFDGLNGLRFFELWHEGGVHEDILLSLGVYQAVVRAVEVRSGTDVLPHYSELNAIKFGVISI